jgi:hypothetical protein
MDCVACMVNMRNLYKLFVENVKGRDRYENTDIEEMIILKWALNAWLEVFILGLSGVEHVPVPRFSEHGNVPPDSVI